MKLKYTQEQEALLTKRYVEDKATPDELALEFDVPRRSIIAKLSSMKLYKKQPYTDKQGNLPVKKEEYIERIAALLGQDVSMVESLEKANKHVLKLLEQALAEGLSEE